METKFRILDFCLGDPYPAEVSFNTLGFRLKYGRSHPHVHIVVVGDPDDIAWQSLKDEVFRITLFGFFQRNCCTEHPRMEGICSLICRRGRRGFRLFFRLGLGCRGFLAWIALVTGFPIFRCWLRFSLGGLPAILLLYRDFSQDNVHAIHLSETLDYRGFPLHQENRRISAWRDIDFPLSNYRSDLLLYFSGIFSAIDAHEGLDCIGIVSTIHVCVLDLHIHNFSKYCAPESVIEGSICNFHHRISYHCDLLSPRFVEFHVRGMGIRIGHGHLIVADQFDDPISRDGLP